MSDKKFPRRFRQGDVMITQVVDGSIPEGAEKVALDERLQKVVLAYGEVTGHAHVLDSKFATMYQWQGDRLIDVKEGGEVTHEEHDTIPLPPGVYKISIQREYHRSVVRNVAD